MKYVPTIKQEIANLLKKILREKGSKFSDEEIEKHIEIPPSQDLGDYAFPCFFLSEKFKESPHEIALEIREKIKTSTKNFDDIQTSGGYINFFVNRKILAKKIVQEILIKRETFGKTDIGKGEKVLVEHTSINPNASPHIGRARNALIGDSIVKILGFLNFKPEVHYYVNDVSKQIAMLAAADAQKLKFKDMLKKYISVSVKVKKSKKFEQKVFDILFAFEHGDKKTVSKFNKITSICIKGQEKILAELGIHYDFFDYESEYIPASKIILDELQKTGKLFKDKDGRFVLNQKGTSVEKKMRAPFLVLTRNDETGLYALRDIAYTKEKSKIADKNLLILGEDQTLYFQQIKEALNLLNVNPPIVIHYSTLLLSEKGKSKKMSTRKGDLVLLEDFLKDAIKKAKRESQKRKTKGDSKKIGISAVKYAILKNNNNKIIKFNLEEALQFEGDTGPYLLYSYARALSILLKSKNKIKNFEIKKIEESELKLVKKLSQFPETVINAYNDLNPSLIANYSYELAQIFNEFYHSSKVIGSEQELFRLAIVESFRAVLKNSLNLLGIEPLDRM